MSGTESTPLVLVGGGGHCLSCIEIIESCGRFRVVGIIDRDAKKGTIHFGYQVLGGDEEIPSCIKRYGSAVVTVGQIHTASIRRRLYGLLLECGADVPTIISRCASVSSRSEIGRGTVVFHKAAVNAGARIGVNCIINTAAIVEHGTLVGDHVHVSTGAIVNGDCRVGDDVFLGSGAVLLQGVHVTSGVVIGAGSLVRHSIEEPGRYAGFPLRQIGAVKDGG